MDQILLIGGGVLMLLGALKKPTPQNQQPGGGAGTPGTGIGPKPGTAGGSAGGLNPGQVVSIVGGVVGTGLTIATKLLGGAAGGATAVAGGTATATATAGTTSTATATATASGAGTAAAVGTITAAEVAAGGWTIAIIASIIDGIIISILGSQYLMGLINRWQTWFGQPIHTRYGYMMQEFRNKYTKSIGGKMWELQQQKKVDFGITINRANGDVRAAPLAVSKVLASSSFFMATEQIWALNEANRKFWAWVPTGMAEDRSNIAWSDDQFWSWINDSMLPSLTVLSAYYVFDTNNCKRLMTGKFNFSEWPELQNYIANTFGGDQAYAMRNEARLQGFMTAMTIASQARDFRSDRAPFAQPWPGDLPFTSEIQLHTVGALWPVTKYHFPVPILVTSAIGGESGGLLSEWWIKDPSTGVYFNPIYSRWLTQPVYIRDGKIFGANAPGFEAQYKAFAAANLL